MTSGGVPAVSPVPYERQATGGGRATAAAGGGPRRGGGSARRRGPREAPFSRIHLENMLRLTDAGAVVPPAAPGFYHQPEHIDALIDFVVQRILDQLHVDVEIAPRWGDSGE